MENEINQSVFMIFFGLSVLSLFVGGANLLAYAANKKSDHLTYTIASAFIGLLFMFISVGAIVFQ